MAATARRRDEQAVADHPDRALLGQAEGRLDDERVGQQGEQRPAVAERVQPVRVPAAIARADRLEPAGHERRRRGQDEGGQADEHQQDAHEVDDRGDGRVAQVGDDRRADEQADQGQTGEDQVERRPGDAQARDRQVAVGVAEQQDRLEEEQDGRPHRGRAAEDRQDQPADERLNAEQQERRQADGQREERRRRARPAARRSGCWWSQDPRRCHGSLWCRRRPVCRLGRTGYPGPDPVSSPNSRRSRKYSGRGWSSVMSGPLPA